MVIYKLILILSDVKVLIVKLSAFGDIIHSLPALDNLLARPEVDEVHWLVDARFAFVTEVFPPQVKIHSIDLKGAKPLSAIKQTVQKLRGEKFDLSFDLQGLMKSAILARLICKKVYGFDAKIVREKPVSWLQISVPFFDDTTVVQQYLRIVQAPWVGKYGKSPITYIKPSIHRKFQAELPEVLAGKEPWVVLNMGGSFDTKELPGHTWQTLEHDLTEQGFHVVWCWGSEKERQKAHELNREGIVLPSRFTMPELCVFLRHSFALIGADTGVLHLAAALGTPTVSFWGPTPSWRNAPLGELDQQVESNPECGPCIQRTCANFICMDLIKSKDLADSVIKLKNITAQKGKL